jgi:hypothetical protein
MFKSVVRGQRVDKEVVHEYSVKMHCKRACLHIELSGSSTLGTASYWLRPKILDMTGSLQRQMAVEPYTPYRIGPHHSWMKRWGNQPKKELIPEVIHAFTFSPYDRSGRAGFLHLSTDPASLDLGHAWGLLGTDKHYQPQGLERRWP